MTQKNTTNRRGFLGKTSLAAGALLLPESFIGHAFNIIQGKGKSPFNGVNVGAISYSFRSMSNDANDILHYMVQAGLPSIELMGYSIEGYAGAPEAPKGGGGRNQTPEQKAEREAYETEMKKWRTSVSMDKFKELSKKYKKEGVSIEIVKFDLFRMSPEEAEYAFNVANAMGAKAITLERSDEATAKLGPLADKHKTMVGYHNHARVNFNSWDKALADHPYNAMNLDIGHYFAGTNESPIPLIKKYPNRISNLHLKDRKKNEGDNLPWGEGETPLKEVLQLLKKENYKFLAAIEQEYAIPEGSDALKEVTKCAEYCREALA